MADSKRLQILKGLTAHIEAMTDYNVAGKVWRGRSHPADESEAPFLIIFELPPEHQVDADPSVRDMTWDIGIQGYVTPDRVHPTDPAHNLMAAVKQQLAKLVDFGGGGAPSSDYMLGGLMSGLEVDGGMCFSPGETTNCAFFALKLSITLVEDLGDPYA